MTKPQEDFIKLLKVQMWVKSQAFQERRKYLIRDTMNDNCDRPTMTFKEKIEFDNSEPQLLKKIARLEAQKIIKLVEIERLEMMLLQ